jgi:glc operon protein GlcG
LGGKETQVFEDMINGGRAAFLSVPELKGTMTGGVPVMIDGQVAGAVGVSGVKPDQDAQTAKAGVAAVAG